MENLQALLQSLKGKQMSIGSCTLEDFISSIERRIQQGDVTSTEMKRDLANVFGIVVAHVTPEPNQGVTFEDFYPRYTAAMDELGFSMQR